MKPPPMIQARILQGHRAAVADAQRRYRQELVRLRDEGWTWGQFADVLGMSRAGAADLVNAARRQLAEVDSTDTVSR